MQGKGLATISPIGVESIKVPENTSANVPTSAKSIRDSGDSVLKPLVKSVAPRDTAPDPATSSVKVVDALAATTATLSPPHVLD